MSINSTIIPSAPCSSCSQAFLGLASRLVFNPSGSPTRSTLSWKILQFPLEIGGFRSPHTQIYTHKHTECNRHSIYDVTDIVDVCMLKLTCSVVSDSSATPWTVARHAPLSRGFSRQESWSGLPFPPPGDLPDPGIEPGSPAPQADSWLSELLENPVVCVKSYTVTWQILQKEGLGFQTFISNKHLLPHRF